MDHGDDSANFTATDRVFVSVCLSILSYFWCEADDSCLY